MSTKKDKFSSKDKFYMELALDLAKSRHGLTGSNPSPPPRNLMGWQLKTLLVPLKKPLIKPYSFKDSIKYSEQVGKYLQLLPSIGEIKYW